MVILREWCRCGHEQELVSVAAGAWKRFQRPCLQGIPTGMPFAFAVRSGRHQHADICGFEAAVRNYEQV